MASGSRRFPIVHVFVVCEISPNFIAIKAFASSVIASPALALMSKKHTVRVQERLPVPARRAIDRVFF